MIREDASIAVEELPAPERASPPPLPARNGAALIEAPPAVLGPPELASLPVSAETATVPPVPPIPPAAPPVAPPSLNELVDEPLFSIADWFYQLPSWLMSMVFHLTLIICLALLVTKDKIVEWVGQDLAVMPGESTGPLDAPEMAIEKPDELAAKFDADMMIEPLPLEKLLAPTADGQLGEGLLAPDASGPKMDDELSPMGNILASKTGTGIGDLTIGTDPGDLLKGRMTPANRAALVKRDGGTPQSEEAVGRALKWLAAHQLSDGSWNFDLNRVPKCHGKCKNPGNLDEARVAATAMALLPFLGQGHTQKEGPYKGTVEQGLYFLTRSMKFNGTAGSLHERGGRMYGHGLASIALCEAYGMTHDKFLEKPAQGAINFIVIAQDTGGGGWRYFPGQAGDTSVVGWQLMALKSGHMAYLKVPGETVKRASDFLDGVQNEYGATYGYTGPGNGPATTAIGLLCRLYLGWKPDHPGMQQGVAYLEKWGPSLDRSGPGRNNMYYNYYATQVMHHVGGYPWKQWNAIMRDHLIKNQETKGHENGSWYFDGNDHGGGQGGRLYYTSMATMMLEVYYRHMPLYQQQSVLDKFGK